MSMLTPQEEANRWLRQVEADLRSARQSLRGSEYSACAFWCQQSAEKALKSLLYAHGLKVFGHSLVGLLGRLEEVGAPVAAPQQAEAAIGLDKHYVSTRYPDAFESQIPDEFYTEAIALEAVEWAEQLLQYVYASQA